MSRPYDIRGYKKRLRNRYKTLRAAMDPRLKEACDARIRGRLRSLPEYKQCKTVLCFVSTEIEVDTHKIINHALREGKIVAAPYCIDGTRNMDFYRIRSLDELSRRTFGVLEPDPRKAEKITDFHDSLCILPGMAFDYTGYRLGYGGGYYDRFLSKVYRHGVAVGICYSSCIAKALPKGRYDVPCQILVTDKYLKRISSADSPAAK